MHIAAGHLHLQSSQAGASASASVLAARRAEETRRKLAAASSELDAVPTSESAWMIDAWAGATSGQRNSADGQPSQSSPGLPSAGPIAQDVSESAAFESSAQSITQIAAQGSQAFVPGSLPPSSEELRRTAAIGPVSLWA